MIERKLEALKSELKELLDNYKNRCLWFSGGSDSRLLLEIMLTLDKNFGILSFDNGWSREQKNLVDAVIMQHDLMVFSYPPTSYLLIGENENISLVANYAVDSLRRTVPVIRDVVDGKACAFDLRLEKAYVPFAPAEWDVHIGGSRFDDSHYAVEKILNEKCWRIGVKKFFEPLAEWTKPEVLEALKMLGVNYEVPPEHLDTGNISACVSCFKASKAFCPKVQKEIDGVEWDMQGNLKIFKNSLS